MNAPKLTEVEYERMLDAMVQRKLQTDRQYLNAENSEEQSNRESEIETECDRDIRSRYIIEE